MSIVNIDKDICTGCQECAKVCPVYAIEGNFGEAQTLVRERCVSCGQCVQKCKSYISLIDHEKSLYRLKREERLLPATVREPLFAAYNASRISEVLAVLKDPSRFTIVQAAPAVRAALAEDFGFSPGTLCAGKMAAALRRLGFNRVYDTNFSADLTIMEEGTELVERVSRGGALPMFTSCCPGWVKFMERGYPQYTKHLSTCKSPQQMAGAVFKTFGARINGVDPPRSTMSPSCPARPRPARRIGRK